MSKADKQIDARLILEYRSGNNLALTTLVTRWHKHFCKKAFFVVKDVDKAKDISQECWRTIIDKLESLKDPNSFGGWAMRIVHTKSIDVLRMQQKEQKHKATYKAENNIIDEPYSEQAELKQKLYGAIQELPIEQQHVIQLFYISDYSLKEIAKLLQIKTGTVKSRLFHAREKLKETLKTYNYEN